MIYLSRFILRNSYKICVYINTEYTNIFSFTTFHLRSQTNAVPTVSRPVISQDIFNKFEMCLEILSRL